jgi:glycosyltransferase involved in cell wall biosynthesis
MNEKLLRVGFFSPGWPLSSCPNGIVAYIQNIVMGLENLAHPIVLTDHFYGHVFNEEVVDITNFEYKRTVPQKVIDKILGKLESPYIHKLRYKNFITHDAGRLCRAIEQSEVNLDILEIEESYGVASALIKSNSVPIVTRLHGPHFTMGSIMKYEDCWDYKLRIFYEGEIIKNSHGITSPSLDVLERVRNYYDIELPHARVIPNPINPVADENRWHYTPSKSPSILFVGRFDAIKGGDLMLQAFRIIAQHNKEVTLKFVGPDRGLLCDGRFLTFNDYLEQEIPELHIKKRIQFLGHQSSEEIKALRKDSLVTVFPSRYENFPVSLLEALSAGCPTVTTPVGGIKEIVTDGYNGLLAEPESSESLADRTLVLLDDVSLMQALSKNAIEDCKQRFYTKVVAAQTLDYYKSIISNQR